MDKERFSLLLLDPGEIYFEDFSAVLVTPDSTIKTIESKQSVGRLKLCSKSLVFEPKDIIRPLIKIPLKDCNIIEEWKGSSKFISSKNVLRIECSQYIEMLERNIIAPYRFCDNGKFIIALNYAKVIYCLPQICQLKRASTLPAIEQADMIATIVHSRHARIHFDPLWLDLYESIEFETQANKITPLVVNPGRAALSTSRLYFQPYNNVEQYPVIKININSIQRIFKRRFLLRHIGLEIYYSDESNKEVHIYLSLNNQDERDNLHNRLINHPKIKLNENNQDVMTLQWQNGVISNFEYLLYINSLGDRSKNDLTQYPIFPWIILNHDSKTLDLNDRNIYRDLSKPMGALNESRLKKLKERYEEMPDPKFMYGSHYSTPGFVLFYLVRLYPNYMLCLQNGRFDHPDRMFNSYAHLCRNSLNDMSDFKELIPEFYDIEQNGAFLVNNLGINFGSRHTGVKVGDVELPAWAENPTQLIRCLRDALESDYVSEHLHEWIDLIFGYKQRGEEAVKANNLYYYLCYEGNVDLDSISDLNKRHTLEVQIMEFGQIPKQVFKVPHPKKRTLLLLSPTSPEDEQRNISTWKNLNSLKLAASFNTHKDVVSSVFITRDCKSVVSAGHDSKIKVFSTRQNRQIRSATIGNMPLSCCIKLPNLNVIIIGTYGNEIILYDLDFGRVTQTVVGHDDAITSLKWANKLDLLCSGSGDCTVCLWKGSSKSGSTIIQHLLHHFDHSSHVTCLSLDSENEHMAVGTEDGDIYIWQMSDYSLIKKHAAHSSKITSIDYSPDDLKLITCSLDRTFQVLDLYTGMSLYKKSVESSLRCLKWDGILLLLGSDDGTLYIWDIIEVKLLYEVQAHEGSLLSIDISPDKKQIVTGGSDHIVKIWNPIEIT